MAIFISHDEHEGRDELRRAGVTLLRQGDDHSEEVLCSVLDEDSRFPRGEAVAKPPGDGGDIPGLGSWHTNNANEFHTVLSGHGIVEFASGATIVSVLLSEGDIMAVRQVEHRYRPLSRQTWQIRHGGGPEAELIPIETGRAAAAWPEVSRL